MPVCSPFLICMCFRGNLSGHMNSHLQAALFYSFLTDVVSNRSFPISYPAAGGGSGGGATAVDTDAYAGDVGPWLPWEQALDQYVGFNEQREVLLGRKQELSQDCTRIGELIESLDTQKEAAIMGTFDKVLRLLHATPLYQSVWFVCRCISDPCVSPSDSLCECG